MSQSESLDFILIGGSENGKSATGNSLLGIKVFPEKHDTSPSTTREPEVHSSVVRDTLIKVVDGVNTTEIRPQLFKAMKLLNNSFSALLIVIRYDFPFSKIQARCLETLKEVLGQNIIRDFGICVLTFGDNFQADVREKKVGHFQDWLKTQTGDLSALFDECNLRCVLFNNMEQDKSYIEAQSNAICKFALEISEKQIKRIGKRKFEMNQPSMNPATTTLATQSDKQTQRFQTQTSSPHADPTQTREPSLDNLAEESEKFCSKIENSFEKIVKQRNSELQQLLNATEMYKINVQTQTNNTSNQIVLLKLAQLENSLKAGIQQVPGRSQEVAAIAKQIHGRISGGNPGITEQIPGGMSAEKPGVTEQTSKGMSARKPEIIEQIPGGMSAEKPGTMEKVPLGKPEKVVAGPEVVHRQQDSERFGTAVASTHDIATSNGHDFTEKKAGAKATTGSVNLLLFGSAGNGKSATGNSILRKDVFKISSSTSKADTTSTSGIEKGSAVVGGLTVNVVDGPGVHNSGEVDQEFFEQIISSVERSMELCDYQFCGLLIVLRFGIRFTKQEVETIKIIKTALGKNVIKEYGICVITYGDNFDREVEEVAEDGETLTFKGWCREQTGEVRNLFEECGFRCVLFDNKSKDAKKKQNQFDELMKLIDHKKRYSKDEFLAADGMQELALEGMAPQIEAQTRDLIEKIRHQVEQIDKSGREGPGNVSELESLIKKIEVQRNELQSFGSGSSVTEPLCQLLTAVEIELRAKINRYRITAENRKFEAASANRKSSMMTPTVGTPTPSPQSKGPSMEEVQELEKRVDDYFISIWSEIKKIEEASYSRDIYRGKIYKLFPGLKEWRDSVEKVGQGTSSVDHILAKLSQLGFDLESKASRDPVSSQAQHGSSGFRNCATHYSYGQSYNQEWSSGVDGWVHVEKGIHLQMKSSDPHTSGGFVDSVERLIKEKWRKLKSIFVRKY